MKTVSLRYFNVFCPGQNPSSDYAAVIPKFIKAVKMGEPPVVVYGDGEQTMDFIFVEDVVRANVPACEAPNSSGKTINIATGNGVSLNQLPDSLRTVALQESIPSTQIPDQGISESEIPWQIYLWRRAFWDSSRRWG